ncbi:Cytochrome c4 [BD1-7 clade bacterium]|uniref:Cytochrome c4 n=1 Tax=BD1-7 clade bacterium TaxID=2029982 RepID=A0A5S9MUU3_9GAMM|nr:Cytochrome c4 [BD1-7 clade bacterium]CAA0083719.1 Cytochrome c4 [BD1-7 clade bacterium]
MKKLIVSVLMMAAAGTAFAAEDAAKGKALSAQCSACHGADGNSPAPNFPKIAGQNSKYIEKQLLDMKLPADKGGRVVPEMSGIVAGLSTQDIQDLAAYYADQTMSGGAADPDLVALGERIYRGGLPAKQVAACSGCHSPAGKGNLGAGYPSLAGQFPEYIEKQLKAFRLGADEEKATGARVNDGDIRIMRDVASRMSDLEIRAVASFLSGLR